MTDERSPQVTKLLAPDVDKNKLLLLGLNLLNKGLRLPCAVVKPQAKVPAPKGLVEKLKGSPVSPGSPQNQSTVTVEGTAGDSRKRKRDPAEDINDVGRKEKRFVFK